MFKSIDENEFMQAIRDKDYLALKVSTVSTMLDDPTFERGETMKAVQILKEHVPEIFEEEVMLDYEERREKSAWDKRYFTKLTYWFQENFAVSRIDYIREVGSAVHRDTAQQYNRSMAINKPTPNSAAESPKMMASKPIAQKGKTTNAEARKVNFPLTGAIVAVGALVLAGILLFILL